MKPVRPEGDVYFDSPHFCRFTCGNEERYLEMHKPFSRSPRTLRASAVVLSASVALGGCAAAEPEPMLHNLLDSTVQVVVDPRDIEQVVFGEIYRGTLEKTGRDAVLLLDTPGETDVRAGFLTDGGAELTVGCTGQLLRYFNAPIARELADSSGNGGADNDVSPVGEDLLATTHIALIESLPPSIGTLDPSPATGCDNEESADLPENFVPLFQKERFTREEKEALVGVTKFITNQELDELVAKSEESGSVSQTVSSWLGKNANGEQFEMSDNQKEKGIGADPDKREEQGS